MYFYKIYSTNSDGISKSIDCLDYSDHLTANENDERAQMAVDEIQKNNLDIEVKFKRTLMPGT